MTFSIHKSQNRGSFSNNWLNTKYSFSFADYFNPLRMGFGDLRVLNDDVIAPSQGFDSHGHSNMEIITLVMKGRLAHEDSTGSGGLIESGDVQVMSAGKGIIHAEFNDSSNSSVELFQIWIDTSRRGLIPRYDQKKMDWTNSYPRVLVSGIKGEGLFINQDAKVIAGKLKASERYSHQLETNKGLFVMNISGKIKVNENILDVRDSIEIFDEKEVRILAEKESLVLIIEVNIK